MRFGGRVFKVGHHWAIEVPILGVVSQRRTRSYALGALRLPGLAQSPTTEDLLGWRSCAVIAAAALLYVLFRRPALVEEESPEQLLGPHDVQDEDRFFVDPVEDPARRHDHFAIWRPQQFRRPLARFGEPLQLSHSCEHAFNKPPGCDRVVEGDVLGDAVQIVQRRLGPNQASHFCILRLASAEVRVRCSTMARSPREMPSRIRMRSCINSNTDTSTR